MELEDERARDQGRLEGMSAIDLCLLICRSVSFPTLMKMWF